MASGLSNDCGFPLGGVTEFCDQIEAQDLRVNSLIIVHDGRKVIEVYRRPYKRRHPQLLFSLSNLFLSAAVGIACDRGFFDLEDRVVSFFPDKLTGDVSPYQYEMRFRHLLTMNAGHHDHNFHVIHPQADWVRAFLAIPPTHRPGTHYCYSKHVSHVLAAIVERTTGKGLVDFLMPRLFEPLGITNVQWETSPLGIAAGGMGLSVPTEGVARFGQLCFVAPAERVVVAVTSAKSNFRQITPLIYRCLLGRTSLQGSELSSQCDELNLDRLKTDSQNHDRQDDERDVLELLTPDESAAVNWNTSFDRADIRFDENSKAYSELSLVGQTTMCCLRSCIRMAQARPLSLDLCDRFTRATCLSRTSLCTRSQ